MKIIPELGDPLYVKLEDGSVVFGTITTEDPEAWILKIGPGNDEFEAVERSSILALRPVWVADYPVWVENDNFYIGGPNSCGNPSSPPLKPTHAIAPGYVDAVGKWHHPIAGDCICGCWGGWSSSSTSIK